MTAAKIGRVVGWAVGSAVLTAVLVLGGWFALDRYVTQPRTETITVAVNQGRQNGENLCDFAVATSDALIAMAGNPDNLTRKQSEKLHAMRHVARQCRAEPPGGTP